MSSSCGNPRKTQRPLQFQCRTPDEKRNNPTEIDFVCCECNRLRMATSSMLHITSPPTSIYQLVEDAQNTFAFRSPVSSRGTAPAVTRPFPDLTKLGLELYCLQPVFFASILSARLNHRRRRRHHHHLQPSIVVWDCLCRSISRLTFAGLGEHASKWQLKCNSILKDIVRLH